MYAISCCFVVLFLCFQHFIQNIQKSHVHFDSLQKIIYLTDASMHILMQNLCNSIFLDIVSFNWDFSCTIV